MTMKSIDLVQLDVPSLIQQLNKAFADEWLAYYQCWIAAKLVVGQLRNAAAAELNEHANDELKHAGMLAERIIQLGGVPLTNPKDFGKFANCAYAEPLDSKIKTIIQQGIEGERCAIEVYNQLLNLTKDKDIITYNILLSILEDEVEHESDFMALLADLV